MKAFTLVDIKYEKILLLYQSLEKANENLLTSYIIWQFS